MLTIKRTEEEITMTIRELKKKSSKYRKMTPQHGLLKSYQIIFPSYGYVDSSIYSIKIILDLKSLFFARGLINPFRIKEDLDRCG